MKLINDKQLKEKALALAKELRYHEFSQVASSFMGKMEGILAIVIEEELGSEEFKQKIEVRFIERLKREISRLPSKGKTIK